MIADAPQREEQQAQQRAAVLALTHVGLILMVVVDDRPTSLFVQSAREA